MNQFFFCMMGKYFLPLSLWRLHRYIHLSKLIEIYSQREYIPQLISFQIVPWLIQVRSHVLYRRQDKGEKKRICMVLTKNTFFAYLGVALINL